MELLYLWVEDYKNIKKQGFILNKNENKLVNFRNITYNIIIDYRKEVDL